MTRARQDLWPSRLIAAPMAGGPSTPALVTAAARVGAFGFLAGGYKTPAALASDIAEVRSSGAAFGVNLFVPSREPSDQALVRAYARRIQPEADAFGLDLREAPVADDDDGWPAKLDLLVRDPVPVVSFTFGVPAAGEIAALRRAGTAVAVTVTTVAEARAAADAGVDLLVAQGSAAGGHSGTHDPRRRMTDTPTADLVRATTAAGLPVVAAGGVAGADDVKALLAAGADAVAVGTLLLRTDESGASPPYQDALVDGRFTETVVTRAFTGRPARALRNAFTDSYGEHAPVAYPAVHHLTRPLRMAATAAGDMQRMHLWAGTGYRSAAAGPAGAVLEGLARGL